MKKDKKRQRQIILASVSPRRRRLMKKLGVKFKAVDSGYKEVVNPRLTPRQVVAELSLGKALAAAKKYPGAIIIGGDTVVAFGGKILGKPKNADEAKRVLKRLKGKTNYVFTGLSVFDAATKRVETIVTTTRVKMKKYSDQTIQDYVDTGEPLDKAGSYAVQGFGANLIAKIEGNRDAALGLPVKELRKILKQKMHFSVFI